jgi:hypothetical protein
MTIGLILKRMRREWRSLTILLLAVCLLTGFFALGPLYIRAVTEVGLRHELDRADSSSLMIELNLKNEMMSPEALRVVGEELDDLAVSYRYFIRADYIPPQSLGGLRSGGLATGAYVYEYGQPVRPISPRVNHAFQPFAFPNMAQILDLVEGRWPVRLPPPEVVDPRGLSDAEQQARQIGIYNRGQVEVVITEIVAERGELEIGSRLVLGARDPDGSGAVASVVVVGIARPKDPADPFWQGNRMFLDGQEVPVSLTEQRWDLGLATIPEAYDDWLKPVTPGNNTIYQIQTDPDAITADNITAMRARLKRLQSRLSAYHPGITVLTDLTPILDRYSRDVSDTEGPIILLSGAILIVLLYHLINTVTLALDQQAPEWSAIASRGGSIPQLVTMQAFTAGLLGLIGMAAGPLLSILFMTVMARVGPLASALADRPLSVASVPPVAILLSAVAGAGAALALTLPALPAARQSLLRLKQLASRPPTRPAWARYALDGALLVAGTGLLLRLYYLVGGDFGDLLNNVVAAPRDVIRLIADHLSDSGGLNDPFNLLGPALILTGAALLWLRFFPWLMDVVSRLSRRSRALTVPLAIWNVARDPGHYAQLVLLLIGTLALGTASLGLMTTRDRGAWSAAREETGGSFRVEVDPAQLDAAQARWDRLPGVSAAAGILRVVGDAGSATQRDVSVFGVEPEALAAAFPELARTVAPLRAIPIPPPPGLALPDNARRLSVQVYSLPPDLPGDPLVTVRLSAYLQDSLGVPFRVTLTPPGAPSVSDDPPTPVEEWLTFDGPMPDQGRPPYTLMRLGLNSAQGNIDAFRHAIYLDLIATQDVFGTSTTLDSFETAAHVWSPATVANPYAASWADVGSGDRVGGVALVPVSGAVTEIDGPGALRLDYRMGRAGGRQREPSIVVNAPQFGRIPVVINAAFAETFAGRGAYRTAADEPLAVGDEKTISLNVGTGTVEIGFRVVGVIDDLPSVSETDPCMIAPLALIQPVLNQAATAAGFFAVNDIWLDLPDREPSDALKQEIADLRGGVTRVVWAWDRYGELMREPLPNAVAGMLFAGFWISLLLSLLDFAFYLMVTARQRLFTFAVLRALGWNAGHLWRLLFIEQVALIAPALVIGSLIGAGLAYLLLPFLAFVGREPLRLPWLALGGMLLALVISFTILMGVAAIFLRRMSVNQALRLGEE